MDLQKFVKIRKQLLNRFEEYYSSRAIRDPASYPTVFTQAENWDKQYEAWVNRQNNKEKST